MEKCLITGVHKPMKTNKERAKAEKPTKYNDVTVYEFMTRYKNRKPNGENK